MKAATVLLLCLVVFLAVAVKAEDQAGGDDSQRLDLFHLRLNDGTLLSIRGWLDSRDQAQSVSVSVHRHPKNAYYDKGPGIWHTQFTRVEYTPDRKDYFVLVHETDKEIFLYCVWNNWHFTVDKEKGFLKSKGEGDEPLKGYTDLVPLRLLFTGRSSGHTVTEKERK